MATTHQSLMNCTVIPGMSQNMALKIGRNAAELSKPCFTTGSSRVARSRAAKALGLRSKRKPVSPQSPPSPNQESAVNPRTGKVAFGPWQGPFGTHADIATAAEPLFLDHNGNTYASLNVPAHLKGVASPHAEPTQPAAAGGKATAAATAATQQLYAMVGKVAQRAAAATTRAPSQWPGRHVKPHGSGRCGTTMARSINQPRRS
ncbi:hypothetical protein PLESTB_001656200 [Pleodorina starrii]|uniref:Uncharacterized protein n=1 Tax=Pleodorina starrii TaxID=330485 RepID=A0A9W6BY34_9CHLO|nr:hypothetical protein PLESTM_002006600 [Pleodorina starrii]GLC60671.1 hypothetical protein PLESTB_001656200 [Pleodorina starrii]GLC69667.1 hypothetical protein PLESTF_000862400 [Pleodorina starrii]